MVLAAGVAGAADEIVLGTAIAQTGKYAREGKFYVDAYTLTVDAVNKAGGVKVGGKTYPLENGRVVLTGPTAELRSDPHVKKAYLGL